MPHNKQRKHGFVSGFLSVFGTTVLLMLVALAVAIVVVPAVKNGAALTVLSGSMRPGIQPGDIIVVEGVQDPAQEVTLGDVITFQPNPNDPTLVTHRVIGFTEHHSDGPGFITQGDDNPTPDDPVLARQVRGVMLYKVPYVGWGVNWVKSHVPWLITAVGISLIAYAIWSVVVPKRRRKEAPMDSNEPPAAPDTNGNHPGPAAFNRPAMVHQPGAPTANWRSEAAASVDRSAAIAMREGLAPAGTYMPAKPQVNLQRSSGSQALVFDRALVSNTVGPAK